MDDDDFGKPLKKLLDEAEGGLLRPNSWCIIIIIIIIIIIKGDGVEHTNFQLP
jgi:hypothetical protein